MLKKRHPAAKRQESAIKRKIQIQYDHQSLKSNTSLKSYKNETKFWKFALPVYVILFLILLDSILAPFLESRMIAESYYFYSILRNFCHQLPSRCLWIFGSNMGLCSRCFGIFLGFFLVGIHLGIKGKIKIFWITSTVLMIPLLLDGITQIIGLRQSNNLLRFITGILFGLGIGSIMFPLYFRLVIFIKKIIKKGGANRLLKNQTQ